MNRIQKAIQLDISEKYVDAADAYENLIDDNEATIDIYINLACLYWYALDPGVSVSSDFFKRADERMYAVLKEAERHFGIMPEIDFWKRYFDFTILGEPPFPELALKLAVEGNILVPYFHVYSDTKDEEYLSNVRKLIAICKQQPTAKNRYILSIADRES